MEYTEKTPYSLKFTGILIGTEEISIYARVILNRQKSEFAIGVRGKRSEWDPDGMRFNKDRTHNNYLNNQISEADGKVFKAFIKIRDSGIKPTAARIRSVFKGNEGFIKAPLLTKYVTDHTKSLKLLPDEYSLGTIAHYDTLFKYLKEFLDKENMRNLRLDEWRRKHFVQFETFLLTRNNKLLKRPMRRATANKYLSKLKVVFNHALANEVIIADPTKGFHMERVVGKREFLTADEIGRIQSNALAGNESLNRVRWLFLFSVYTGLRFSDAINLKRESVIQESDGNHYIEIIQQKTKEPLYIPLLAKAVQIYTQFKEAAPESDYVLPRITNQKTNAYLKVIADLCEIKKKLTHHIARHSFATSIMLDQNVDLKTTSFFMGHSSIKTTEIYAKITKNRAVDVIKKLDAKMEN